MQPAIVSSFLCLAVSLAHGAPLIRTANSVDTTMEISSSGSVGILRHGGVQIESSDGQEAQHAQRVVKSTGDIDQTASSEIRLRSQLLRQAPFLGDLRDLQDPDDDIKSEPSGQTNPDADAALDGRNPVLEEKPYIPDNETKPDIPNETWAKPVSPSAIESRFKPEGPHPTDKTVNATLANGTNWDAVMFNETFDDKILDGGGIKLPEGDPE